MQRVNSPKFDSVKATESSTIAKESNKIVRSQPMRNSRRGEKEQPQQSVGGLGYHVSGSLMQTATTQVHRFRIGSDGRMRATLKPPRHPKLNPGERPGQLKPLRFSSTSHFNPPQVAPRPDMQRNLGRPEVMEDIVPLPEQGSIDIAIRPKSPEASSKSKELGKEASKLQESLDVLSMVYLNLPTSPVSSNPDPFDTLPLASSRYVQLFVHHYFGARNSSWLMMSLRKIWFSLSIDDTAFFHCTLSYYAGNFYRDLKQPDSSLVLQYRTTSINLVNERLGNPENGISDGTIGTVAGMSLNESYLGTLSSAKLHIKGLEQMVNMRGGFQRAQFSMNLQRLLAWADLSFSNAFLCDLHFPSFNVPTTTPPSYYTTTAAQSIFDPKGNNFEQNECEEDFLSRIFGDLRTLTVLSAPIYEKIMPESDWLWYSDKIYILHRKLFEISLSRYVFSAQSGGIDFDAACIIACLLYSHTCLRNTGFRSRLVDTDMKRLRGILEGFTELNAPSLSLDERKGSRILWGFTIGGLVAFASNRPDRGYFVRHIANFCSQCGLVCYSDIKAVLSKVLWSSHLEIESTSLWPEVLKELRALNNNW